MVDISGDFLTVLGIFCVEDTFSGNVVIEVFRLFHLNKLFTAVEFQPFYCKFTRVKVTEGMKLTEKSYDCIIFFTGCQDGIQVIR